MRTTIAAVFALLIGVVVGGYQARSELAEVTAEFEQQDCEESPVPAALVAGMLSARAARNQSNGQGQTPGSVSDSTGKADVPMEEPLLERSGSPAVAFDINSDEGADLDALGDIMALRSEQARDVLIEQTDPTEAQLEELDAVIGEMNDALVQLATDIGAQAKAGSATRSSALVLTADALNVIIDADNQIYGVFDADQLSGLDDEALDPFSYVDASVLDAFTASLE